MRIAVSACLLGRNCKYNGDNNLDEELAKLLKNHQIVEVCPEKAGSLPTPRPASEIVGKRVVNVEGADVTDEFLRGSELCAAQVKGCDLAILQPRSPSCGVHQIYDGSFSRTLVKGQGVFARMLREQGIPCCEPEEAKSKL